MSFPAWHRSYLFSPQDIQFKDSEASFLSPFCPISLLCVLISFFVGRTNRTEGNGKECSLVLPCLSLRILPTVISLQEEKKKKSPGTFQSATVNPKTLEMEGIFNLLKSPEVLFLMLSNCFSIQTPSEIGNLCLIIPSDGELC